jgi:hypothetical protein
VDSPWAPDLVFVSTPLDLKAAIAGGFPHIELRTHMDLTTLSLPQTGFGFLPESVKSIRVRTHIAVALVRRLGTKSKRRLLFDETHPSHYIMLDGWV